MFASLYEKALLTHAHEVGDLILVRIFYKAHPPRVPPVVSSVPRAYPCTKKYFPGYLSCENSENSRTMAFYGIRDASSKDLQQIVDLSANLATTDLLMNIILQNSFGESLNSVESRKALAKHRYDWALSNAALSSNVLVSHNYYSPHVIEASAWIQFFGPDPSWFIPWKNESGTFKTSPDCANAHLYEYIENALHTDRKIYMHGKCHYCVSIKPSILTKW